MKIDFEKIKKWTNVDFTQDTLKEQDKEKYLFDYIKNSLEYLKTHNKNYNQKQYWAIMELADIFDCIEIEIKENKEI